MKLSELINYLAGKDQVKSVVRDIALINNYVPESKEHKEAASRLLQACKKASVLLKTI